jgi:signal transduction histidine kinase
MGIMNVAHSDWRTLSASELALLTTVGNQLGLAVDRARLLDARAERAIRDERGRLARELHDTVMQRLTGIGLQIETADATLDGDPERARGRLRAALKLTQEALAETRATVDGLDPASSGREPLHHSLPALCAEFEQLYDIPVRCDVRTLPERPPASMEVGLFRIVREGLNNVVKHAGASRAAVRVRQRKDRVTLIVEDDGRGFDRARAVATVHGYGLHSMRRRASMMGGRFRLRTAPGLGTRVEVSIPLEAPK